MMARGAWLALAMSMLGSMLGSIGCFGPLDSPLPPPPPTHDAGVDLRRDVVVDRRPDILIIDVGTPFDAPVSDAFDAGNGRDAPPRDTPVGRDAQGAGDALDARDAFDAVDARGDGGARDIGADRSPIDAFDADTSSDASSDASDARVILDMRPPPPDAGWPVVPGCVTGVSPVPEFQPTANNFTVGCGPNSNLVALVYEGTNQGMVISAMLDPPIAGFELAYTPTVCAGTPPSSITVNGTGMAMLSPGWQFTTNLRVQIQGPGTPTYTIGPLTFIVATTYFSLGTTTVDFGNVFPGDFVVGQVQVYNSLPSAPIDQLMETPASADPFFFSLPAPGTPSLQPGMSGPLITIFLSASTPGRYFSTFTVSPFLPGVFVDPACGMPATLHVQANVLSPPPPPLP